MKIRQGNGFYSPLFALIILLLGLSGCENSPPNVDDTTASPLNLRIVTVNPVLTDIVFALGQDSLLVGRDQSSQNPDAAKSLPEVGYHRALSAEKILALKPTTLLTSNEAGPAAALTQIGEAGVQVWTLPNPQNLTQTIQLIDTLGKLLNAKPKADSLRQALEAAQEAALTAAKSQTPPRVLVVYDRGGADRLYLLGTQTPAHALLQAAGAQLAVDFGGHQPLSTETILASKTEWLLMPELTLAALGGEAGVRKHAILGKTPAAQAGQILTLPNTAFMGLGASVIEALPFLSASFFPVVSP
jgi:iron complex transport system substrate-binding protein